MEQEFTVLENKTVGRNIYKFRKVKEKKAAEIADYMGITEAAYTKYERGESQITIDVIQKVAEYLNVDPVSIITNTPGNFIENGNNSPIAINGFNETINEDHIKLMTKLVENQIAMNEKILALLEKK